MRYFTGQSADDVWRAAAGELLDSPDHTHTGRNGLTREILPCILRIQDPRRRWILSRRPAYNPAFGLVEFVWIITGNNESRVLNYWNPGLPKYSGTGEHYHGAYGFRLRREFGVDQIRRAFDVLTNAPETRQAVLQIWKPDIDMPKGDGEPVSKDIPCNVMSLLKVRNGQLHWTQIMRSNDIMRGLPYNIIQFTLLQEVMASWLGLDLGEYFHLSDSLHIYEEDVRDFSVCPVESCVLDVDCFSLNYERSNRLFEDIYSDLKIIAGGSRDAGQLRDVFSRESDSNRHRPDFLKNAMTVIGSDAARRQGFPDLAHEFVESCTNATLRLAADAWVHEQEGHDG